MKRILYTTLVLLSAALAAQARDAGKTIKIDNLDTSITGERLDISFDITAAGLDLGCDGQLMLELAVENDERRTILPVVVYSGRQRYIYERRREELSGAYHVEPYKVYRGVKKNRTYELNYRLSIPYYTWMEHASVTYREYTHDCSGDNLAGGGALVADLNPAPVYVEPEVWAPNPALYPNLVGFLVPEVEEVKARASMIELNINFPVNKTEIYPAYMNNPVELRRADSLVTALSGNDLIDIRGVIIKGYASPEGSYANNERLARGRSQGFKQYLAKTYPHNEYIAAATTMWVAEDWDGLAKLVSVSAIPNRDEVMSVVADGSMSPDTKDALLKKIGQWSFVYKVILEDMYPKLRRIELRVDYTVRKLTDSQARELLYTNPDMLSLDEIYRVASYYEPGSRQYMEVYEIAARQYPGDVIANTNAAAALLREGRADEALPYLEKTKSSDSSLINYGAYYYITGDLEKAAEYFTKAKEAGIEQADQNLRLTTPAKTR